MESCFNAIAHGCGDAEVAADLGIPRSVAGQLRLRFRSHLSAFFAFLDHTWASSQTQGFLQTACGQRLGVETKPGKVSCFPRNISFSVDKQ